MKNSLSKIYNNKEFMDIIQDLADNPTVQEMKKYRQHANTSCFDHCLTASYYCYLYSKKFNLDYKSAARGAMLHDLFLYDWRKREYGRTGFHAFTHPKTSYENASKIFKLNKKESDIILKHMWPVTFFEFPKYKESFLLTLIDKYCALSETFNSMFNNLRNSKIYKYAYVLPCVLFIKK